MAKRKKGLRIGPYRITPMGLGVLGALVVVIAAIVAAVALLGGGDDAQRTAVEATRAPMAEATAIPAPTAAPTPTPTPAPRSATIRALGEIAMETDLLRSAADLETGTFDFSPMFSEIAGVVGDADYTIADVEGTLGDTMGFSGEWDSMHTPSALLTALRNCGVDMLFLGNDHAMDGTFAELQATIDKVEAAGMAHVGTNRTAAEKAEGVIEEINGISVGFVGYCEALPDSVEDEDALSYGVNLVTNSDPAADVQNLRAAGADVVVALVNWGEMFEQTPSESQQQIASILNAVGVDVIIGYNPHTVQPALWLESTGEDGSVHRTLCICSTGNFLSNQREPYYDCGVVFEFTIQEQADGTFAIESPVYIPTYVLRYERQAVAADASASAQPTEAPEDAVTLYDYRTLAAGQWTDEDAANLPEGMGYADLQYMATVWSQIQNIMADSGATVARE